MKIEIKTHRLDAVVFDMDGLLLDTEPIALRTFVDACRENNFEPDLKIYYQCIGGNSIRTKEILINGYGPNFPYKAITDLWRKHYDEETHKHTPLKMGVKSLLDYLAQLPVKKAVVTSSRYESAIIKLSNAHILQFFDFILGGDQVKKGKPDPEMYLTACQKLAAKPDNSLALEDSENGVQAALNARLMVIQVPDLIEPSPQIKTLGHTILDTLVDVEMLLRRNDGTF
jgi:HAD superfamily hydrolase (TIGR01509 family)